MKESLSKDVFLALAAIAWADGDLGDDQAKAIVRAAREAGWEGDNLASIEAAVREKQELSSLDLGAMTPEDRVFVYATAVWLSRFDGVVEPAEREALWKLGDLLKLPDGIRTRASAAAFEVAQMTGPDKPERYDFVALERQIAKRLGNA
ncbi:MAG: hypothetical protein ACOC1F_08945 [Myxococcota bacterium]